MRPASWLGRDALLTEPASSGRRRRRRGLAGHGDRGRASLLEYVGCCKMRSEVFNSRAHHSSSHAPSGLGSLNIQQGRPGFWLFSNFGYLALACDVYGQLAIHSVVVML